MIAWYSRRTRCSSVAKCVVYSARSGLEVSRIPRATAKIPHEVPPTAPALGGVQYSGFGEQAILKAYVEGLALHGRYCVDIGAGDGIVKSNSYALYQAGWRGLSVEFNAAAFAGLAHALRELPNVDLARCKVTPLNVISLLEAYEVPKEFTILSLDIDGYDHYVLEKILASYRPRIVCTEINEKIPSPVKFTVKWDPDYILEPGHFYGQSIDQLYLLCLRFDYHLVALEYNNAFLIPAEINHYPALTPAEAYKVGYLDRPDRLEKLPWNADVEKLQQLSQQEAVAFIKRYFKEHEGAFECSL